MLHTKSFVEIGPLFPEKKLSVSGEKAFRRVFTIYMCGGHFGHVTKVI